ncbi:hypothetical protein [Rhodomicrobium lacus]|jgi:cytochrome c oxidase assembly factor CtaG|uniref:hypothetical protein n=1 Tax=Rhodomicrobium TaxID=1068 RepID=UPI0013DFA8F9|nr:hypothetical protein [Rhodomicrobium lacus]WKW50257.1 hypothetical protein QMO75_13345 [Rhodomicrobium lacus]
MKLSYLVWLVGVIVAVIIALATFNIYTVPVVYDWLNQFGTTKALLIAIALIAVSKLF